MPCRAVPILCAFELFFFGEYRHRHPKAGRIEHLSGLAAETPRSRRYVVCCDNLIAACRRDPQERNEQKKKAPTTTFWRAATVLALISKCAQPC